MAAGFIYPGRAYPAQPRPGDGSSQPSISHAGLIVEAAFGSNPGQANPAWVDISQYVLGFQVKRGRQKELDRIDAGTLTMRFNNSDRRFDPSHTGSPWYPFVLPMRRIRVRYSYAGTIYNLFSGFVESWPQTWEGPNVGFVELTATDGFRPLATVDVGTGVTWPQEFSGARINRILDAAGWSPSARAVDAGYSQIEEDTFALGSGATALGAIQDVADAELGMFFCDGRGYAVFHDRHHRKATAYLTSQATFGDANTGGLPYQTVVLDTDADRIWNDVQITTPGSTAQQAQDITSQNAYLRRTLARNIPLARDTEAADQAAYLLALYKDPRNRLSAIKITPTTDALWVQALGRELADHITVKRWPQQIGAVISQECAIEALELNGDPSTFTATWLLSTNIFSVITWGIIGDATYGAIGSTFALVY